MPEVIWIKQRRTAFWHFFFSLQPLLQSTEDGFHRIITIAEELFPNDRNRKESYGIWHQPYIVQTLHIKC